ncbi:MAG: DNA integrity scanning diadenylate cyclase DisA [Candidatus Acetothermia bacterium]|nr:DNA integrity scanning diadenylate cyclase DisA [Candidatus Acetothermia bacterium]MDH7506076.1 DNA integrity scanning diadenylate cyclase DisA [Candidatus Acetothermia bacterium]
MNEELLEILKKIAPGTPLREAVDSISERGKGGLIVIAEEDVVKPVIQSGFRLNTEFTPQRLSELAKMDRALVVDPGLKKIIYANAFLIPDPTIPSEETGTRHLAAEQVAKQLGVPVIAISAALARVTIYYGQLKYTLHDISAIISRVNQALRILEQYRGTFDDLLNELTMLEFEGRVFPFHVANVIQLIVQMLEIEDEVRRWFVELGTERELLELLLEWMLLNVNETFALLVRDFQVNAQPSQEVISAIRALPTEELLSTEKVMEILGYESGEETLDTAIPSRGFRVLREIPRLPLSVIEELVQEFGSLKKLLQAEEEELMRVKGIAEVRARAIKSGLERLKRRLGIA